MPLTRYQIRNEYNLADPELYRAADRDDPEALLEGVAMAGLVGVLRQLGDLAEFAAEIFHDLHEEVMSTAARGHGLMARVQQLEAEFPSVEKTFLSQTNHSLFFSSSGIDWHPILRTEQNLITRGDLPRCILDSYEECRGPPRLFLLDKYDVAGAGSCLKRYTDPSFFKIEAASSGRATSEFQREKKYRKGKKKGSRWRIVATTEIAAKSHAKLHQLFLEERVEKDSSDPSRLVKLKRRPLNGFPLNLKSGRSYMEKILPTPSSEHKTLCENLISSLPSTSTSNSSSVSGLDLLEINTVSAMVKSPQEKEHASTAPDVQEVCLKPSVVKLIREEAYSESKSIPEPTNGGKTNSFPFKPHDVMTEKELINGKGKTEGSLEGFHSEDLTNEVDNYMDALNTMESEMESDSEYRGKNESEFLDVEQHWTDSDANRELMAGQVQHLDSESTGNTSMTDDGTSSFKKVISSSSYSDTRSISADDSRSDGEEADKLLCSLKHRVTEEVDVSSNQLPVDKEVLESNSHKHAPASGWVNRNFALGDDSNGTCHSYSSPTLLPLDLVAISRVASESGETSLDHVKHSSEELSTEDFGSNLDDSLVVDIYSQKATFTESPKSLSENDFGDGSASTDIFLPFSSIIASTFEEIDCGNDAGNHLQTDDASEKCLGEGTNGDIAFAQSIISPMENDLQCLAGLGDSTHVAESNELVHKSNELVHSANNFFLGTIVDSENISHLSPAHNIVPATGEGSVVAYAIPDAKLDLENVTSEVDDIFPPAEQYSGDDHETPVIVLDSESVVPMGTEGDNPILATEDQSKVANADSTAEVNWEDMTPTGNESDASISENEEFSKGENAIPAAEFDLENVINMDTKLDDTHELTSSREDASQMVCLIDHQLSEMSHDAHQAGLDSTDVAVFNSEQITDFVEVPMAAKDPEGGILSKEDLVKGDAVPHDPDFENKTSLDLAANDPEGGFFSEDLVEGDVPHGPDFDNQVDTEYRDSETLHKEDGAAAQAYAAGDVNNDKCQSSNLGQTLSGNHMLLKESSGSKESQRDGIDDHVASSSEYYVESETQIEMSQTAAPIYSVCDDIHDLSLTEPIKNDLPADSVVSASVSSEATAIELGTKLYNNSRPEGNNSDDVSSHTCNFLDTGTLLGQSLELHAHQVESLLVVEGNSQLAKLESEQIQCPDSKDEEIYLHTSFESYPEEIPSTSLTSKSLPQSSGPEVESTKQALDSLCSFPPSSGLPPEVTPVNSEEMPPFPPLPPMQWRIGKFQLGPPSPQREVFASSPSSLPIIPPFVADSKPQFSLTGSERGIAELGYPFLPSTFAEEISHQNPPAKLGGNPEKPSILKSQYPSLASDTYSQHNGTSLDDTLAPNQYLAPPASSNGNIKCDFYCLEDNIAQSIPSQLSSDLLVGNATFRNDFVSIHGEPIQASNNLPLETSLNGNAPELISENSRERRRPLTTVESPEKVEEQPRVIDHVPEAGTSESLYLFGQHSMSSSEEKTTWPSNAFALAPTFEVGTTNGYRKSKLPRPRSPLIDAVVAHDRSTLRKVSERVRPQAQPKVDERDTWLEQIRTKSFNLKPAMVAGPSIQGPKTNLKLAAILEKANAIRQATAGSDEDEDTDSWSDS